MAAIAKASASMAQATATSGRPAATPTPEVERSLRYCEGLTRERARDVDYALRLTPEPKRSALHTLYAYTRQCDDLVDTLDGAAGVGRGAEAGVRRVEAFRRHTDLAVLGDERESLAPGPLWPAVRYVTQTYRITPRLLHDMLDGHRMDLIARRYATFDEVYAFSYRVASTVVLGSLEVGGHDGEPGVPQLAEYRGVALQLTNILRDVAEDAGRDRIYFPLEDLARFGVTEEQVLAGDGSEGFVRLVQFEVERARSYFEMSASLERHLSPDYRRTSWVIAETHRRLLERIATDPLALLHRPARLSTTQKLRIATRALWWPRGA